MPSTKFRVLHKLRMLISHSALEFELLHSSCLQGSNSNIDRPAISHFPKLLTTAALMVSGVQIILHCKQGKFSDGKIQQRLLGRTLSLILSVSYTRWALRSPNTWLWQGRLLSHAFSSCVPCSSLMSCHYCLHIVMHQILTSKRKNLLKQTASFLLYIAHQVLTQIFKEKEPLHSFGSTK